MKIKFFAGIVLFITLLSACGTGKSQTGETTKEKTEYEVFVELYTAAVDKITNSTSSTISEKSRYEFYANSQKVVTSLKSKYETIVDPFYAKGEVEIYISNVGTVNTQVLVLKNETDDNYTIYSKESKERFAQNMVISPSQLEKELENEELDISLRNMPQDVTVLEEKTVKDKTIVVYESTFKLSDLPEDDQILFDTLLEFYIGPGTSGAPYTDIEITKLITLNKTKSELLEISYDLTELITTALNDYLEDNNVTMTVTNTSGDYSISFEAINSTVEDTEFIEDMTRVN